MREQMKFSNTNPAALETKTRFWTLAIFRLVFNPINLFNLAVIVLDISLVHYRNNTIRLLMYCIFLGVQIIKRY